MSIAPGTHLGAYEVIGLVGSGGMGDVYRARDARLERVVALKLLTTAIGDDARGRLLREARVTAALNHPHICTIHEIAEHDDHVFIVMELIDGHPLSTLTVEALPVSTVVRYGCQVADALAHAHERGIIHRDLKTANLMVTADGRVKVLDFGIAMLTGDAAVAAATRTVTGPGSITGTTGYIAPEVLRGAPADRRSDIWALGIVLYEMAAGRRPFGGKTSFEISSAILRDEPEPLARTVPAPLRAIILRCLSKDAALRYQQAGEVRAALDTVATMTAPARAPRRSTGVRATKTRGSTKAAIRSIAVLPLENLSRDPEQEYFADGMTEAVIGAVAQIDGLRVISRTSIMRFRGTQKSVPEIARELNVQGIITGSVRRAGDRVRISAQLIDAATDTHTWSANFDRDLSDILALESEISQAVAAEIALKVRSADTRRRAPAVRKIDPETYALHLKGRHLARQLSEAGLRQATACFEQAIARDSAYAPAYASLANAYHWLAFGEWTVPRDAYEAGGRAAAKAVALDPDLAEAHAALGGVKFNFEWDWSGAERAFRRAIEINPNAADLRVDYGLFVGNLLRPEDGITQCTIARDLDPLWGVPHQELGYWTFLLGRFEESAAHHEAALQLGPDALFTHCTAGFLDLAQGRRDEALGHFRHAASSGTSFMSACLAYACAVTGRRSEAERLVQEIEVRGSSRYISRAALCWPYVGLDKIDDAIRCLRIAYDQHDSMLVSLPYFPWWDPIRHTDTFRAIFERMKFPAAGRQALVVSTPRVAAPPATAAPAAVATEKSVIVLPTIRSIAVLPLDNLSRDPEQEYFADGMTEALIADLAQIAGLRVISRTSVMRFKRTTNPTPEIARELGVEGIVTGSVLRSGDSVRIAAQLIHGASDTHLWARNYEGDVRNVLQLQREIAAGVAREIQVALTPGEQARLAARHLVEPVAYDLYLRGRQAQSRWTEEGLTTSVDCFERAIASDPRWAPAHASLAESFLLLGTFGVRPPKDMASSSRRAAMQALQLDESLAEANTTLGFVEAAFEWKWTDAQQRLRRALTLNPGSATARFYLALLLFALGRSTDAIAEMQRARHLDPLSPNINSTLGWLYAWSGQTAEATEQLRRTIELEPSFAVPHMWLGETWRLRSRHDEAIAEHQRAVRLFGGPEMVVGLGHGYAVAGHSADARAILDELTDLARRRYVSAYGIALVHVGLHEDDRALEWLDRACEERSWWVMWLEVDPRLERLRDTDAFRAIIARMNFPGPVRQVPLSASIPPVAQALPAVSQPAAAEKSVIVLPFANLSPDADDAYFSDGLTEELITDLSRVAGLRVVPSAATFRLKAANKDLATVAREFRVTHVVEGRIRKAGQSVRITAQLVEVAEDRTVWADKYSGDLAQAFELQERVSRAIADALQLTLQPASRAPKPEAAEAFLKGRHFARQATSAGFLKAVECFRQATELDPNHAAAFAALAETYVNLTSGWETLPALETMPKAQAAVQRALELDRTLPEAHLVRGLIAMYYEWDLGVAEREFQEALRLNPNHAAANGWYSGLLIWLDTRYELALDHVRKAATLDPVDLWIQVQIAWVYGFSRDFDRGVEHARRLVATDRLYGFGHYALGCMLNLAGRADEAIHSFQRGIDLDGRGAHHVALLGMACAITGQRDKALGCLAELDVLERAGRNVATWKVHVHAGLGDADQVIRCLEVAVEQRTSSTVFMVTNPYLDFVRQDPRFVVLLQKMGLGYLANRTWTPEWRPPAIQPGYPAV